MNQQQKKSCEFISTNVWVRILVVEDMAYTIYRVTALHTPRQTKLKVVVLLCYHDKNTISVHKEGEALQIISGVQLREKCCIHTPLLYGSHTMCSLDIVYMTPEAKTNCDQSVLWTLRPQDALRFIIHCIARDISLKGKEKERGSTGEKTLTVFSAFPLWLADLEDRESRETRAMSFCTHYDGYRTTTYVHVTEDGMKLASVDEETVASSDECPLILDMYSGMGMSDGKVQLLKILMKWTSGMVDNRYTQTKNVRNLLMEMPDELFTKTCTITPFCRVDDRMGDHHRMLTLCLASKPNDHYIQLRLALHRFLKANISRSLNTCIEAVLKEH